MVHERKAFLFYHAPGNSKEIRYYAIAEDMDIAGELNRAIKDDSSIRALPRNERPLVGATHASYLPPKQYPRALEALRALKAGTESDPMSRTLYELAERLKPELARRREEAQRTKADLVQLLEEDEVEAAVRERVPDKRAERILRVWKAVRSIEGPWIDRTALEGCEIRATSVDRDHRTYGAKEDREGRGAGKLTRYRKEYLLVFLRTRWLPRG